MMEDAGERSVTTTATYPVLESGDRLTQTEFHRRYCASPHIKKAELVEGVVYVASPVRQRGHGGETNIVQLWLGTYAVRFPDLDVGNNSTVILDADNEVQPDGFLYWLDAARPGAHLNDRGYVHGAPLLVVEVTASTASYDLHDKLRAYRRNGVREYIVWRTLDGELDWFRLIDGDYVRIAPDERGIIESTVFPGLRLSVPALLARDRAAVLAALAADA
jgi:Uma2 family endonuclease